MESMRAALKNLVFLSPTRNLMYITDVSYGIPVGSMQHLSCYFPALLALGNHLLPDTVYSSPNEKTIFALAAEGLADTCYIIYADQASGLGPEEVQFQPYTTEAGSQALNYEPGRWMKQIEKWIKDGKSLDDKGVPGVHRFNPLVPVRGDKKRSKGYWNKNSSWYLRPEVRCRQALPLMSIQPNLYQSLKFAND